MNAGSIVKFNSKGVEEWSHYNQPKHGLLRRVISFPPTTSWVHIETLDGEDQGSFPAYYLEEVNNLIARWV